MDLHLTELNNGMSFWCIEYISGKTDMIFGAISMRFLHDCVIKKKKKEPWPPIAAR